MGVPQVVIVGRPNVGKSSIFNWLARKRLAIVDNVEGVTRDRVNYLMFERDRYFELVDTGGIGVIDEMRLEDHVNEQIQFALGSARLILFVVDVRDGLHPLDSEVARILRKLPDSDKRVMVVANKADVEKFESQIGDFYKLGLGEVLPISAEQKINIHALLDQIVERLPVVSGAARPAEGLKLALVGKRNVGKSTLTNLLCGEQRVIVSDIPGTTRDSIDVPFERKGKRYVVIDTAGMRRKSSMDSAVELYSHARSERAIRRADVCLFMMDAIQDVSNVDQKLADYIVEQCKPCIFCVNKFDLARDATTEAYVKYVQDKLPLYYAPITFMSAKDGVNIDATLKLAAELFRQSQVRIGTGKLNAVLRAAVKQQAPKVRKVSQVPKVFYATQVAVTPPTFIIFVNDPELFDDNYRRFLANVFRENFDFAEIPLRLYFRARSKVDMKSEVD